MIKQGQTPPEWRNQPSKLRQKDRDARWTKKNEETFYGYKNHVRADADSMINTDYRVTDAGVHDSQPLPELIGLRNQDEKLFEDSAYKSAETDARRTELGVKIIFTIRARGIIHCPNCAKGSIGSNPRFDAGLSISSGVSKTVWAGRNWNILGCPASVLETV